MDLQDYEPKVKNIRQKATTIYKPTPTLVAVTSSEFSRLVKRLTSVAPWFDSIDDEKIISEAKRKVWTAIVESDFSRRGIIKRRLNIVVIV